MLYEIDWQYLPLKQSFSISIPLASKTLEFKTVRGYMERSRFGHRVEVVINMSMPTLHRLAGANAKKAGKITAQTDANNRTLSKALGGTWWQEIMWTDEAPYAKERAVIARFADELAQYLPFTGYCPVSEKADSAVKYYITFASGHVDALVLMNNSMCKAYEGYIFDAEAGQQQKLWGWKTGRDFRNLEMAIVEIIREHPDLSRETIWQMIVQRYSCNG